MLLKSILTIVIIILFLGCAEQPEENTPLVEKEVEYTDGETSMKGFLVYDGNIEGKRPGILVVHEWWGHNDYARKRARMLAELGYIACAVDMYGDGKQADHPDDASKYVMEIFNNIEKTQAKFMAAYNLLKQHEITDPFNIAAIGYCFGGGVVLHMARIGTDLKAAVSFHGGIQPITPAAKDKVKAYLLVCNGADDPFIKQEQIDGFKAEMDLAEVDYEFINFPGTKHSFTNPGADSLGKKFNLPLEYNEKADKESWEKMKTVFQKLFEKKMK